MVEDGRSVLRFVDVVTREELDPEVAKDLYPTYGPRSSKEGRYRCDLPHVIPGKCGTFGLANIKYRAARTMHYSRNCQKLGSRAGCNTPHALKRLSKADPEAVASENSSGADATVTSAEAGDEHVVVLTPVSTDTDSSDTCQPVSSEESSDSNQSGKFRVDGEGGSQETNTGRDDAEHHRKVARCAADLSAGNSFRKILPRDANEPSDGNNSDACTKSKDPPRLNPSSSEKHWQDAIFLSLSDAVHAILLTCENHQASLQKIYTKLQRMNLAKLVPAADDSDAPTVMPFTSSRRWHANIRITLIRHNHRFEKCGTSTRAGQWRLTDSNAHLTPLVVSSQQLQSLGARFTPPSPEDAVGGAHEEKPTVAVLPADAAPGAALLPSSSAAPVLPAKHAAPPPSSPWAAGYWSAPMPGGLGSSKPASCLSPLGAMPTSEPPDAYTLNETLDQICNSGGLLSQPNLLDMTGHVLDGDPYGALVDAMGGTAMPSGAHVPMSVDTPSMSLLRSLTSCQEIPPAVATALPMDVQPVPSSGPMPQASAAPISFCPPPSPPAPLQVSAWSQSSMPHLLGPHGDASMADLTELAQGLQSAVVRPDASGDPALPDVAEGSMQGSPEVPALDEMTHRAGLMQMSLAACHGASTASYLLISLLESADLGLLPLPLQRRLLSWSAQEDRFWLKDLFRLLTPPETSAVSQTLSLPVGVAWALLVVLAVHDWEHLFGPNSILPAHGKKRVREAATPYAIVMPILLVVMLFWAMIGWGYLNLLDAPTRQDIVSNLPLRGKGTVPGLVIMSCTLTWLYAYNNCASLRAWLSRHSHMYCRGIGLYLAALEIIVAVASSWTTVQVFNIARPAVFVAIATYAQSSQGLDHMRKVLQTIGAVKVLWVLLVHLTVLQGATCIQNWPPTIMCCFLEAFLYFGVPVYESGGRKKRGNGHMKCDTQELHHTISVNKGEC